MGEEKGPKSCARSRRSSLGGQRGQRSCGGAVRRRRQAHRCSADGGGGVPGSGVGESANERREKREGVLLVLMRAKERASGLFPELCTAAARWRPAGARCCVVRRGEDTAQGKSGSEGSGATRGRPQQAGGGSGALLRRRAAWFSADSERNREAGRRWKAED